MSRAFERARDRASIEAPCDAADTYQESGSQHGGVVGGLDAFGCHGACVSIAFVVCCPAALPELHARRRDKCGSGFAAFAATDIGPYTRTAGNFAHHSGKNAAPQS